MASFRTRFRALGQLIVGTCTLFGCASPPENQVEVGDAESASARYEHCGSTRGKQRIAVFAVHSKTQSLPTDYDARIAKRVIFGDGEFPSLAAYISTVSNGRASIEGDFLSATSMEDDRGFEIDGEFSVSDENEETEDAALDELRDAIAKLASIDFRKYDRFIVVLPNFILPDNWAGVTEFRCSVLHTKYGTLKKSVIFVPAGSFTRGTSSQAHLEVARDTLAHELGHNFGFGHITRALYPKGRWLGGIGEAPKEVLPNWDLTTPMGGGGSGFYHPKHLRLAGWIDEAQVVDVTASGTFSISPVQAASGVKALRVLRDEKTHAWFWISYQQPLAPFTSLLDQQPIAPYDGASIYYEDDLTTAAIHQSNALVVVDKGAGDSITLKRKKTWTDDPSGIQFRVDDLNPERLTIQITLPK